MWTSETLKDAWPVYLWQVFCWKETTMNCDKELLLRLESRPSPQGSRLPTFQSGLRRRTQENTWNSFLKKRLILYKCVMSHSYIIVEPFPEQYEYRSSKSSSTSENHPSPTISASLFWACCVQCLVFFLSLCVVVCPHKILHFEEPQSLGGSRERPIWGGRGRDAFVVLWWRLSLWRVPRNVKFVPMTCSVLVLVGTSAASLWPLRQARKKNKWPSEAGFEGF